MAAFPRPTALAVSFALLMMGCRAAEPVTTSTPRGPDAVAPTPPSVTPAGTEPAPGAPRYAISLRASDAATRWRGTQEITFTNTGTRPMPRVWLRAWGNGIAGCAPLAVQVTGMTGGDLGRPRRSCTALPVDLTSTLAPGATATISFDLSIAVPARNDRFGHHEGIALLGNAVPTLAIHDDTGWHLDPYVDLGESFASVVGRYRVVLDVPGAFATPSTGSLVRTETHGGRQTRTYVARDVRDFAWAAGRFDVVRGTADGTSVGVWYDPSYMSVDGARLALRDAIRSMNTYASSFGAYPYPGVEVVAAAFTSFQGMEYPRIVFSNPARRVIAHELAHQWWYAVVGNDQYAEPWLDESFATWASTLPWTPWTRCPAYDWPSDGARLTNDMGYWGEHPEEYATVYEGGGCMLADLADRFGLRRFTAILAGYAADHWLGLTTTEAFQARIERAAARHLDAFDTTAYWKTWRIG